MTYGTILEVMDDPIAPSIVEIAVTPDPVELTETPPSTQMLSVMGSMGEMYASVGILNSDVVFATTAATICTVDTTGLVTAVAAGTTTVTATYNDAIVDVVDVVVA